MELRMNPQDSKPSKSTRPQHFLGFKLQSADEALFDSLTDLQRRILLTEGTYQEKADKLGIPIGTIRSNLHRARAKIEQLRAINGSP